MIQKETRSKIRFYALLASVIYLLVIQTLMGLKVENWIIFFAFNGCIWLSGLTRRFMLAFSIFLVFGILYDLMKVCPNYKINPVDIGDIYHLEKHLFGFATGGTILTPNEYFALHHHAVLDVLCGLFYLTWVPVPLAFAFWLYLKNKKQFLYFSLTFLLVNLIGFCGYYIHPAAPPWYVAKYGFHFLQGTGGNTAGLGRFDALLHVKIFDGLYARNSNVFAAMPSLHCAYPLIVFYYSFQSNVKNMKWLFGFIMVGIWFTAVYSGHHYILDAIAGIFCALFGIIIFQKVLLKIHIFAMFLSKYEQAIS